MSTDNTPLTTTATNDTSDVTDTVMPGAGQSMVWRPSSKTIKRGLRRTRRQARQIMAELADTPEPALRGVLLATLAETHDQAAMWSCLAGRYGLGHPEQAETLAWVASEWAGLARAVAATEHERGQGWNLAGLIDDLPGDWDLWTALCMQSDRFARAELLLRIRDSIVDQAEAGLGHLAEHDLADVSAVGSVLEQLAETEQTAAYLSSSEPAETRRRRVWVRRLLAPVWPALLVLALAADGWIRGDWLHAAAVACFGYQILYSVLDQRWDPACEPADHGAGSGRVSVWCPACAPDRGERLAIGANGRYAR